MKAARTEAVLAEQIEAGIEAARQRLILATAREDRLRAWLDMKGLIESRGPLQILRMERAKGLRR